VGQIAPSADGKFLYTGGGIYTREVKPVGEKNRLGGPSGLGALLVPAHHGNFYLSLVRQGDPKKVRRDIPGRQNNAKHNLTVHMAGDARALAQLNDVELSSSSEPWATHDFTADKRVHFIPDANLIVVTPVTRDKLVLYRFNLDEAIEKSGIDYLFVSSRPITEAVRGGTYEYPVAVKSKKGGVTMKIDAGPKGLSVAADGKLTWAVPRDFDGKEADVLLTISDASGQEVFHSFRIAVRD
jgi:hypothetical protein